MRLSEWRASSPSKDAGSAKVAATVDPVLRSLGAEPDPQCWVAWGEEPGVRYTIFVPTAAGLVATYVRVNVPGEGPRATGKLIRWSRVQLGELSVETQATHRLLSFQVEQQVLHGSDDKADRIARFALELLAAVDGRVLPPEPSSKRGGARRATASGRSSSGAKTTRTSGSAPPKSKATSVAPATRRKPSSG